MKIRSGFVSNSSSSSFVVAVKKGKTSKVTLELEVDLTDYSRKILSNKDDVLKYMKDYYDYEEDESSNEDYVNTTYKTLMEHINNGNEVIVGDFSSEGDEVEQYLCNTGLNGIKKNKSITVIQSEAGY